MIVFKKFGKTVKIRNDDWKNLRKRFDAKNAKWDFLMENYRIVIDCSFCNRCKNMFNNCGLCPFVVFDSYCGCVNFLKKIFKPMRFQIGKRAVYWYRHSNKIARKQLGQLLKMMDKIEEQNKRSST